MDLAFIGVPTIFYLFDQTGILSKRNTHEVLNDDGREQIFPEIPVILNETDLVYEVNKLLKDPKKARAQAEITSSRWHYKNTKFDEILEEAIDV